MKGDLTKKLTILVAVITFIGIALFVNVSRFDVEELAKLDPAVGMLVTFSQALLYITIAITLVLSILGLVKNPEALKKTAIGLGILLVLLVISYVISSDAAVLGAQGELLSEAGATSKWTGTGITYSIILGIIGGGFFVFDLLKGLIK